MVLCNPVKPASASISRFQFLLQWNILSLEQLDKSLLPSPHDSSFIIQFNSWWKEYRILVKTSKTPLQIAHSQTKEEIISDWKFILEEFAKEVKQVGSSSFSDHHISFFFTNLCKRNNKSEVLDPEVSLTPSNSGFDFDIKLTKKIELLTALSEQRPKSEIIKLVQSDPKSVHHKTKQGLTALHLVCAAPDDSKENLELVKLIISKGANINAKDSDGWTPLHSACQAMNLNIALFLLKNNANVLTVTRDNTIPASYLVRLSFTDPIQTDLQLKILELMIDSGVSVSGQNNVGNSLLHYAARTGHEFIVKCLIKKGADVNARNKSDETPLHIAARFNRVEVAKLLVENNADIFAKGPNGTASELAFASNKWEVMQYLQEVASNYEPVTPIPDSHKSDKNLPKVTREVLTSSQRRATIDLPRSMSSETIQTEDKRTNIIQSRSHAVSSMENIHVSPNVEEISQTSPEEQENIGTPQMNANNETMATHSFKKIQFKRPTWCESCEGFIWSLLNCYMCEYCGMIVHKEPCKKIAFIQSPCTRNSSERKVPDVKLSGLKTTYLEGLLSGLVSKKEIEMLFYQFNKMDSDQDGLINEQDMQVGLASVKFLATNIFKLMKQNKEGKVECSEYILKMSTLMKGSLVVQLEHAFQMFGPDSSNRVTKSKFEEFIQSVDKSLGAIQIDAASGFLEFGNFVEIAERHQLFIRSLGLLQDDEKTRSVQQKKGGAITFGHQSWDLAIHMMFGIRIAVAEITSSYKKNPRKPEQKDFELQVDYELKTFSESTKDAWIFKEYTPLVFHHIRENLMISPNQYMYSLGPEKLFGNFLLGNLESICAIISTGRSGSFFFRTNDGKYLIKTLPLEEHRILQGLLKEYMEYLQFFPNTLLTRFCGLHSMRNGSEKEIQFTVMENLFDSHFPIHEQYDLKGSTVNRHVENVDSNPDIALKDNDFKRKINIGIKQKAQLLEQIESDARFLENRGICDYRICFLDRLDDVQRQQYFSVEKEVYEKDPSVYKRDFGGILSADGKELYFLGIIDILTTYNLKKMGEHFAKSFRHNSEEISAIGPNPYRKRFMKYIESIIT